MNDKSIRVLINGAFGKMGRLSAELLKQQSDMVVVAECGRTDSLSEQLQRYQPDVALDLTSAEVALANLATILEHGVRPVIGSSGLNKTLLEPYLVQCKAANLGGIIAPNFSIAAVLMMRFAAQAAPYFESAEIIEMHHPAKRDAPSGTAIRTAELLQYHGRFKADASLSSAARGMQCDGIPIHAVRMHGVLAKQQVLLGNPGELLVLEANTEDRQAFMPGVLLCCRKVMELTELIYGLDQVLS